MPNLRQSVGGRGLRAFERRCGLRFKVAYANSRASLGKLQTPLDLGVSRQTIMAIDAGKCAPSLLLAFKIARAFGLSIAQVIQYEDDVI